MIKEMLSLKGRTALVTGSSQGIGRAIAIALAEAGADVIVHGSKPSGNLDEATAEVRAHGGRVWTVTADLSAPDGPGRLVAEVRRAVPALDILVLNVSVQARKPLPDIGTDEMDWYWRTNFRQAVELIQAFAPAMVERRWGRILTVGSVQQQRPHPQFPIYAALKSAMENLVRNLAVQYGPHGVTVNNLSPGVILTGRNEAALSDPDYAAKVTSKIPVGYFGEARDCAGMALLVCSEAGRYIHGADLPVDGGLRLPG
jgi:gluconate 5-dehydrogenase